MNRRDFLRGILPTSAALALAPSFMSRFMEWLWPSPPPLTEAELRAKIIAEYLKSPQGREKLAAAMVQPIRTRLDYDRMGRQMFVVQPMGSAGGASLEKDEEGKWWAAPIRTA